MLATVELDVSSFTPTVESEGVVLVDFWAEWCGPCRMFAPWFENISEEFPEVTFAKVDTESEQMLAGSLGIRSIPTLMAFRDGILVYREAGALPERALRDLVTQILDLDMGEVRASLTQQADGGVEGV